MSPRLHYPDGYELASCSSIDSQGTFNLDEADFESQRPPRHRRLLHRVPLVSRLVSPAYWGYHRLQSSRPFLSKSPPHRCRRRLLRHIFFYIRAVAGIILALLIFTAIFQPSYTRPPPHYAALREAISQSKASGRGNLRQERIFIAVSLYDRDGGLARGQWGSQLLQLIDLLGEENVFLSVYENDSGSEGENALRDLERQVSCNKSIVFEEHLDLHDFPRVIIPGGSHRVVRVEYLAEVRNRALRPLDESPAIRYDKLLFLNDVMFDPVDILHLLFSTNLGGDGVTRYRAACAIDFENPFKFYDTYATRDLQGYSMGLPFFPWFTTAGEGQSRKDVLAGTDAVRVRSCWGGAVAFDAQYFQHSTSPTTGEGALKLDTAGPENRWDNPPARFRAPQELFWEASECCLIHADIQPGHLNVNEVVDSGIYLNPFVRVAYGSRTLSWLWTTRRVERLYRLIHNIGNHLVGLPRFNPRRAEIPGQRVERSVWVPNGNEEYGGSFETVEQIVDKGGYCGRPGLQVIVENREEGQAAWESIPLPA
ncbi:hypothetical protein EYZ11_009122 [Aspergillus tanneri]|uniref:Cryptococcal mannosyltransferase 1 n=1 Tax=Aspergillus tanneri TaxID=1220188 RepID=A0A4S3J927_9EURO|nr:uncharacterized protein ATNIH1004_002648 [Aspergillus tanneri]KAA8649968.1 hypothetical protein ATNIH1004_002648 [Aspergillus tanneri]THC91412.1 hypothetical protein EYZ11_009122 [Aspergillus tanneri]